ncbi:adenine phosphoribosyltransferase-like isoform 1-T1 [Liasis olivaceus]
MDLRTGPASREQGWYLKLMAPNVKGPTYAWLDPSRLYCHPQALHDCVEDLVRPFQNDAIDQVVGIDAMGFILGAAIAATLQKGFVAIRKVGHLCVETLTQTYRDYSARDKVMEIRTDAICPGLRVLLVDQWVETGGTMRGAVQLVERQGGVVAGCQIASPEFLQSGPLPRCSHCSSSPPTQRAPGWRARCRPGIAAICIEDSDSGCWLKSHYKWSHCVPPCLMPQFNAHQLDSFQAFRSRPPSEEQPQGHPSRVLAQARQGVGSTP